MITRFVLTLLIGLVVSLGALVSGGSGVAWAGNWNLSDAEKVSAKVASLNDKKLCFYATTLYSTGRVLDYIWNPDPSYTEHVEEAKRRSLTCNVYEKLSKELSSESTNQPTSRSISETANVFTNQPDPNVCLNVLVNADAQVEAKRRGLQSVLILEADVRPLSNTRYELQPDAVAEIADALRSREWSVLRLGGQFTEYAWSRNPAECPAGCACTPVTRRTCEIRPPPAWGGAYCEADVAQWALVFGWTGVATALYNYLVELWFWRQWRWARRAWRRRRRWHRRTRA